MFCYWHGTGIVGQVARKAVALSAMTALLVFIVGAGYGHVGVIEYITRDGYRLAHCRLSAMKSICRVIHVIYYATMTLRCHRRGINGGVTGGYAGSAVIERDEQVIVGRYRRTQSRRFGDMAAVVYVMS